MQKYLLFFFLTHLIPSSDLTYIIFFINGISDNITIYIANKILSEYGCKYIYGEFLYYMILLIHCETYSLLYTIIYATIIFQYNYFEFLYTHTHIYNYRTSFYLLYNYYT